MKFIQPLHGRIVFMGLLMMLLLAACERPFQADTAIEMPEVSQPANGEEVPFPPAEEQEAGEEIVDPAAPAEGEAAESTPAAAGDEEPTAEDESAESAPEEEEVTEEDAAPPLETNEAGQRIYVVASGDSISRIALLYGVTIEDIAAANPDLVSVDVLDVGQELIIPEPGFAESEEAAATAESASGEGETAAESTEERIHVVRAGDTIYSIGLIYGFTVEELQEYNDLTNPNVLKIGDEIRIPPASSDE